jgi:hypothetical protein
LRRSIQIEASIARKSTIFFCLFADPNSDKAVRLTFFLRRDRFWFNSGLRSKPRSRADAAKGVVGQFEIGA